MRRDRWGERGARRSGFGVSDNAEILLAFVLFATVLLRVFLVAIVAWLMVPRRDKCPQCSEATVPLLESHLLRYVRLERRWCLACGWNGVARKGWTTTRAALAVLVIGWSGSACQKEQPQDQVAALFRSADRWVDLTHSFDEKTIYWPTAEPFKFKKVADGPTPGGYYYSAANFSAAEHGGTHLDAPVHFAKGHHTTDEIPVSQLVGSAVVIDVTAKTGSNPDYLIVPADLQEFETAHGRIADGSIVL